jgi:plastocyanin
MLGGSHISTVDIKDFIYGAGDLTLSGRAQRPPTVKQGQSLTFRNLDSPQAGDPNLAVYHTITACKSPCNKATGIAYPVANGTTTFDSGELGYGPRLATAAAQRVTWNTPRSLKPGTYTYFCRVHPFMRGSFRVVAR